MSENSSLSAAKAAKQDEFYTQYEDINCEVEAYLEYNPDTFRGKTVLLPCDDPEWSNFTMYFAQEFRRLGLRKLISTSYAPAAKAVKYNLSIEPNLFEQESPQYNEEKSETHGRILTLDKDITHDGKIDFDDIEWGYLEGDGDFRSAEVR